jgi:hypothetical protein
MEIVDVTLLSLVYFEAPIAAALAQHCTRLASLQLGVCNFMNPGLQQMGALTQLTQLRLDLEIGSFHQFISDISSISGLKDLRVVSSPSVEHMSNLRRVAAFQSLTSLQLSSAWFGSVDFGCLWDLPSLRALCIAGCSYQGQDMHGGHLPPHPAPVPGHRGHTRGGARVRAAHRQHCSPHPPHQPGHQHRIPG